MPCASYWPLPSLIVFELPGQRAPLLDEDAFLGLLQNLLPRGRAWPRDPDAVLTQLLRGLAAGQARTHQRSVKLIDETRPDTTYELLTEWEASLGLPDPCAGADPTVEQRKAQVLARWQADGGQSVPYLISVAAALGITAEVEELSDFHVGEGRCGDNVNGLREPVAGSYFIVGTETGLAGEPLAEWSGGRPAQDWDYAMVIRALQEPTFVFLVGAAGAGDYLTDVGSDSVTSLDEFSAGDPCGNLLVAYGNRVFECELRRVAPAHVTTIFAYGSP